MFFVWLNMCPTNIIINTHKIVKLNVTNYIRVLYLGLLVILR